MKNITKRFALFVMLAAYFLAACNNASKAPSAANTLVPHQNKTAAVPNFKHIVVILFENTEFDKLKGNPLMPVLSTYAHNNTLLTNSFAVRHPSLPNYLALIGGDTFGVTSDCKDCFTDSISLPDLIEKSGRTWKTYQEDMPSPCFLGNSGKYAQKHNPFIYFKAIRENKARCEQRVVPLGQLDTDISKNTLPNFIFISPNLCNSGHDCTRDVVDHWINDIVQKLQKTMGQSDEPYLIILTWDEGTTDESCCGLPSQAGGHIATFLISPQARSGFLDDTPYSHYSILKTISEAWDLPYLGHAGDTGSLAITKPWK